MVFLLKLISFVLLLIDTIFLQHVLIHNLCNLNSTVVSPTLIKAIENIIAGLTCV